MALVLGEARSCRVPNLACRGTQSPGDLMFHQKVYMRHDAWAGALLWWSCQTPAVFAHSCGLLNHPNSFCERMFKLMAKFDAELLLYSLSCFEWDGHTVHMLTQQHLWPHWLVQWSQHCSCMHIPVHSPWLSGYINVTQIVLVILTVPGLFLDRLYLSVYLYREIHIYVCVYI